MIHEKYLQAAFIAWLGPCQEQVQCSMGRVDVVDNIWVYELKVRCRSSYGAVGQAVLYAALLNRRPCVVLEWAATKPYKEALKRAKVALIVFRDGVVLTDTRIDHDHEVDDGPS